RGEDWKGGGGRDACVGFVREPADVLESMGRRFCLDWTQEDAAREEKIPTVDVVTGKDAGARTRVRRLMREARHVARVRHVKVDAPLNAEGRTALWNEALRLSRADYVLFWDEPLWLPEKALARMLEYFKVGASLAVVAASCRDADDLKEVRRLAAFHQASGGHRECGRFLHGDLWMLRRGALRQTGLFDERFRCRRFALYDYGFRLRQSGFRLFTATDVTAWRVAGKTSEIHEPRVRAARDLGLLQKKWCENGIGAILKLSRPARRKGRAAAVRVAGEDLGLGVEARFGNCGLPEDNDARTQPADSNSDCGRVSAEMKMLMDESLRETDRRNDGFRRVINERSDRLSQEFRRTLDERHDRLSREIRKTVDERHDHLTRDIWKAAESLREQSSRMQRDMHNAIRSELAALLLYMKKLEPEALRRETENRVRAVSLCEYLVKRFDKLGNELGGIAARLEALGQSPLHGLENGKISAANGVKMKKTEKADGSALRARR
ncbi:MAG: hypothetical protein KGI84_08545, partial [Elusimicrobia bacterium]|nr:hypothetical protein [Elusimicrobiota bacterium]